MEIVIEEVIGWNIEEGRPREDVNGLFGVPEAFTATVEEQGRRTLHAHIQIWIKEFNEWREELHSPDRFVQRNAKKKIEAYMDEISRCSSVTQKIIQVVVKKWQKLLLMNVQFQVHIIERSQWMMNV